MNKKIIIEYANDSFTIESDGKQFDVERISGIDISEWSIPFWIDNIRWNGLYDELKDFCGSDAYIVIFHGTDENLTILRQIFQDKPVKVVGQNNKVIIIYDRDKLTTKMTINGKIFDTSRIADKPINEWVVPFSNDEIEWKGIFAEIEDYIGTNTYAIQFMGNTDDMRIIMDNSPGGINITYRTPTTPKKSVVSAVSKPIGTAPVIQPTQSTNTYQPKKTGDFSFKNELSELLLGAKEEFIKLKAKDKNLALFTLIAVVLGVIALLIFIIKSFFISLITIPVAAFSFWAYKKEFKKMKTEDKNLTLLCIISVALVVVARLIQMIFIKESLIIQLTIIPTAIFCVIAYKKDYKMLAVASLVSVLLFSIISYRVFLIRDFEKALSRL